MRRARTHRSDMKISHIVIFGEDSTSLAEVSALLSVDSHITCLSDPVELQSTLPDANADALILIVPGSQAPDHLNLPLLSPYLSHMPLVLVTREPQIPVEWLQALLPYQPRALLSFPLDAGRLGAALAQNGSHSLQTSLAESQRRLNERVQEINTIYTVGRSVTASLDVNEILERIIDPAVNLTQADSGFVILKEEGGLFLYAAKHYGDAAPELLHAPSTDRIAQQVIRSGRPAMLHRKVEIDTNLLARAFLYVPLRAPGLEVSGVLGLVNWKRDVPFTESQLFALTTIANFTAVALENARLFKLMKDEHSRLTAILRHAAEAIIVTGPDERLWLCSDAAADLFGLPQEYQGKRLRDLVQHPELQDLFSQVSPHTPYTHAELELENGGVYNTQVTTIDGIGRMVVMQNITHLKELDRLKSEFVSTVSHDLRTPLTTVQGYIELLDRAGPLTDLQSHFVETALASLDHITALISDLLDIGRTEAGYDLEMRAFRFDQLIETAVASVQIAAREAGIEVTCEVTEAPLWIRGNERRLRQVLENLLANAMKYNRKNGWVRVVAGRNADHVVACVSDSGIGIPQEEQAKIFDRFYRVQSAETETITGTGLGLAIVKSVVEKHKGRVWVKSVIGKGSTFTFVLPPCEAPDSPSPPATPQ